MSQSANIYIERHKLLSRWTDELEYLGYILTEIVDPQGLDERGFEFHQAVDLPTIEDTLKQASHKPGGRLNLVLAKKQRQNLLRLMSNSRRIRNAVAHHQAPSEDEMLDLHRTKNQLTHQLQSVIGRVASIFNIDYVDWYADANVFNQPSGHACRTARISLRTDSLLSQRQEALVRVLNTSTSNTSRRRRKATEESREQHRRALIASQNRKDERARRNAAMLKSQAARRLQRIDSRYYASRQHRLGEMNRLIRLMWDEEREWKDQRSRVTMPGTCSHDHILSVSILVFLAVSSPVWLCCVFMRKLWVTICSKLSLFLYEGYVAS